MKTILPLLALLGLVTLAQAQSDQIKVGIKLVQGDHLCSAPTVTVLPGKESKILVTRDFVFADGRTLPVGVILEVLADFKDGKIKYSGLLTLREPHQSLGSVSDHAVSSFKTQEFMLAGVAESGKEVKSDLGEGTTLSVTMTRVTPDGREKNLAGTPPSEPSNDMVSSTFLARIQKLKESPNANPRTLELYQKASNAFTARQFEAAQTALKWILKMDPYDTSAYQLLSQMRAKREDQLKAGK